MPAFYAHYKFGQIVLKELSDERRIQIEKWKELFDIGLHGPDILFFYHPLLRHPIGKEGVRIHHLCGREYFDSIIKKIRESSEKEAMMAYAIGMVCHLALDAACHPFINRYEKRASLSHHEIEKELEKKLMRNDGVDPFSWSFAEHFSCKSQWAVRIAPFYGLDPHEIFISMESFVTYSRFFFTDNRLKRAAVFAGMRLAGCYRETRGFFVNKKDNELCRISNKCLEKLFFDNISVAAEMAEELYEAVCGSGVLSDLYERTFSG